MAVPHQKFLHLRLKRNIHIGRILDPERAKKAMIFTVGLFVQMEGLAPLMLKPQLAGALSLPRLSGGYIYHVGPGDHNRSTSRIGKKATSLQHHRSTLECC